MGKSILLVIMTAMMLVILDIANASQLESQLSSVTMSCQEKKVLFNSMDKAQMQSLFSELQHTATGRVILANAKYRNDLMNQAFIQYEKHPWSGDDMRVLQLVRAILGTKS